MPSITITDTFSAKIDPVSANPNPLTCALTKYETSSAVNIVLLPDSVNQLKQPLLIARQTPLSLNLDFSSTVDFGTSSDAELTVGAAVTQKVNVNAVPASNLVPAGLFGSPVVVNAGEAWLSLALNGNVNLGLSGSTADLKFGITSRGGIAPSTSVISILIKPLPTLSAKCSPNFSCQPMSRTSMP